MEIEFNGIVLSSKCSEEDEAMSFVENGIIYSCDGRKLLKATSKCGNKVIVREETLVICDNAFRKCTLSEVVMPKSLIIIGDRAFNGSGVKNIYIPDNVEGLGDEVFGDCAELEEIRFGRKIKNVRLEFFRTYSSDIYVSQRTLKRLKITGVTEIADDTFEGFHSLESIAFGESLIRIGNRAFSSCRSLQNIDIPNSVVEIGCCAFSHCENVKTIKLGTGLKCINDMTFSHCGIQDIVIPDNIQEIKFMAFSYCGNLKNVHFGKSLKTIENNAFSNTRIENIEIPENVKEISYHAFNNCSYLTQVRVLNSNAKIEECAFEGCNSLSEKCRVSLTEKFGPYLFQQSTGSKIMSFLGELWDNLTGGIEYKNPLFP